MIFCGHGSHIARKLTAFLNQNLAVTNFPTYLASGMDNQLVARSQFTLEISVDLGHINTHLAREGATLGNLDHAAIHRRFHSAFHDEDIAILDFCPFQLDVRPYDQTAAGLRLQARNGFFCLD